MNRKISLTSCFLLILLTLHIPKITATSVDSLHAAIVDVDFIMTNSYANVQEFSFNITIEYWNPRSENQTFIMNYYSYLTDEFFHLFVNLANPNVSLLEETTSMTSSGPQYIGIPISSGISNRSETRGLIVLDNPLPSLPEGSIDFIPRGMSGTIRDDSFYEEIPADSWEISAYHYRILIDQNGTAVFDVDMLPPDWGIIYSVPPYSPSNGDPNGSNEMNPRIKIPSWTIFLLVCVISLGSGILIAALYERQRKA